MATTGRVRRLVAGMLTVMAVASALLGTGVHDAGAQPIKGVKDQNGFVAGCRENGGTSTSVGPRTVKCSFSNGAAITCNFAGGTNPDACVSYVPPTARTTGGGQPGGRAAVDAPTLPPDAGGSMVPLE